MTQSNQKDELVAYIDLLAFSNYIRENTQDALSAFTTYHNILKTKIIDNKTHPISSYQSQNLQELAKIQAVTSVDYFLPFSDSIFLKSADPNLFVKQISSFLVGCFIYTSHAYAHPENVTKPTEVTQSAI